MFRNFILNKFDLIFVFKLISTKNLIQVQKGIKIKLEQKIYNRENIIYNHEDKLTLHCMIDVFIFNLIILRRN